MQLLAPDGTVLSDTTVGQPAGRLSDLLVCAGRHSRRHLRHLVSDPPRRGVGEGDIKPPMFTAGAARARIHGLVLCLLGAGASATTGGCNNNGSLPDQLGVHVPRRLAARRSFQPGDCGRVGRSGHRDHRDESGRFGSRVVSVPCGLGFYDGSLAAGSWTLELVALDAIGQDKEPADTGLLRGQTDMASPVEIHTGKHAAPIPVVTLTPSRSAGTAWTTTWTAASISTTRMRRQSRALPPNAAPPTARPATVIRRGDAVRRCGRRVLSLTDAPRAIAG